MDEFLSDGEITHFTGFAQRDKRLEWLKHNGIPHKINGKGNLVVSRIHAREALEGKRHVYGGLNMEAII